MEDLTEEQREYVDGLRALADFLEAHPDLIEIHLPATFHVFPGSDKAKFARLALQLGTSEKSVDSSWYNVERSFGPHKICVATSRSNVCEKIVVGSETVEIEEADPEVVAALPKTKRTVTVEKTEWLCPESLHALAAEA